MPNKVLEKFYTPEKIQNQVDIGIINASFHQVNYNPKNENNGALRIGPDNKFERINNNPPFLPKHTFIAAPLKLYVVGKDMVYRFNKNLLLENTERQNITTLTVNFDTGQTFTIIDNGKILQKKVRIAYAESGIKTLTFTAAFEDGSRLTTVGVLNFKLQKTLPSTVGIKNDSVFATIPFKGYYPNDPTLPGRLDYRIFYHTVNDAPVETLIKPIVIIDGFDPGDKRQIEDSDPHPEQTDAEHRSIADMMTYFDNSDVKQFLIPELQGLGYDVVDVNHPKYQMFGVDIDGGADYIERNARTHVQLYQELNAELAQNNSMEQLVIVGPSMGGQISRYALAYMEKHNIPHNTRLWVSVDSPHLGANIPMGVQTLLHLANDYNDSEDAKEFVEDQLGSPAAKQQLIEQHQTVLGPPPFYFQSSTVGQEWLNARTISQGYNIDRGHPFFKQFYDNLFGNGLNGSNGYPQNLRKITIVNGSMTNTKDFDNPFEPWGTDFTTPYADYYRSHGAQVFKMKGDANVLGHIVTLESYFMPSFNNNHKIAYFKKWNLG